MYFYTGTIKQVILLRKQDIGLTKNWLVPFFSFDKILTVSTKINDKLCVKYLSAIFQFISYMIEVFKEAEILENENIQISTGILGSQKC